MAVLLILRKNGKRIFKPLNPRRKQCTPKHAQDKTHIRHLGCSRQVRDAAEETCIEAQNISHGFKNDAGLVVADSHVSCKKLMTLVCYEGNSLDELIRLSNDLSRYRTTMECLRNSAEVDCAVCTLLRDAIETFKTGRSNLNILNIDVEVGTYGINCPVRIDLEVSTSFADFGHMDGENGGASGVETEESITQAVKHRDRPSRGCIYRWISLELFQIKSRWLHIYLICQCAQNTLLGDLQPPESHDTDPVRTSIPRIGSKVLPSGDTSSEAALQSLDLWIQDCIENHTSCKRYLINKLPKRILDIHDDVVYLKEQVEVKATYACLSHCWGPRGPAVKLERATEQALAHGLPIAALPQTFQDAVQICKALRIQFIWIDALCIMQDDKDDWKEAAATMADIYENAYLTIAATWSKDSSTGIFTPDPTRFKSRTLQTYGFHVREAPAKFPNLSVDTWFSIEDWPLLGRAWVYQERRLSPRIAHFGKDEIYWECKSAFRSESGPLSFSDPLIWRIGLKEIPLTYTIDWKRTITEYSRLNLTYESDRLPALAAVVEREIQLRRSDKYVAGMWKSNLLEHLLWRSAQMPSLPRSRNRVPTWSWVSSQGAAYYEESMNLLPSLQLVDVNFTPHGPINLGEVTDASIRLRGQVLAANLYSDATYPWQSAREIVPTITPPRGSLDHFSPDYDWSTGDRPLTSGDPVLVMMSQSHISFKEYRGIILRQINDEVFERIGIMIFTLQILPDSQDPKMGAIYKVEYDDYFSSLPTRELKIV